MSVCLGDPLKTMCSSRCAIPVSPYPSCRDPTRYVTFTVVVCFDESGKSSSRSPLARRYSVMPSTEPVFMMPSGRGAADGDATGAEADGVTGPGEAEGAFGAG